MVKVQIAKHLRKIIWISDPIPTRSGGLVSSSKTKMRNCYVFVHKLKQYNYILIVY